MKIIEQQVAGDSLMLALEPVRWAGCGKYEHSNPH